MQRKIRVGIIFGGKSSEHEVSLLSAKTIFESLDLEKYEPVLIGIDKSGEWHLRDAEQYLLHEDNPKMVCLHETDDSIALVPKKDGNPLVGLSNQGLREPLDVVFPIVHGTNGEDGTIQGLLKLAGVPFVGASVLGSAVGMDKDVMKRLMRDAGIPIGKFLTFYDFQKVQMSFSEIVDQLGLPLFVKPANNGSSIGISKVKTEEEFIKAIDLAFSYDRKILIEEFIKGREIECSVMGNERPIASLPGEVIANGEFNSWDAKYVDDCCTFVIPAQISPQQIKEIQDLVIKTYRVLCCEGMGRVDCFLTEDGRFLVNEINTIPGFTKLSVFPRLWEASGVSYRELVGRLIDLAIERHDKESLLTTSFKAESSVS
ncbi:MAG: D-alanine--D-alanine ligase [Chlamydiae bacterium]|nr:D-alanine--D-alanine ligase [Chlamydiota bacterium]